MVTRKNIFLLALFLPLLAIYGRKGEPTEIAPPVKILKGLPYALPKTGFVVDLYIERKSYIPGPYASHARELLHSTSTITSFHERWSIVKSHITPYVEASQQQFFIAKDSNMQQTGQLAPDGRLVGVGSVEFQPAKEAIEKEDIYPHIPPTSRTLSNLSIISNYFEGIADSGGNRADSPKIKKNDAALAADAAEQIFELRQTRLNLLSGNTDGLPADGSSYQLVFTELEKLERNLTELFNGKITMDTFHYRIVHMPADRPTSPDPIGYFSSTSGFSFRGGGNRKAIELEYEAQKLATNSLSGNVKGGSYKYRIPVWTKVSLFHGDYILSVKRTLMFQYGIDCYLPSRLLERHNVRFSPTDGTIEYITRNPEK